jgi:hypothetical protein
MQIEISEQKLRLLGETIRRDTGGFTSEQVRAFLVIYGEELQETIENAVKQFLKKKLER